MHGLDLADLENVKDTDCFVFVVIHDELNNMNLKF